MAGVLLDTPCDDAPVTGQVASPGAMPSRTDRIGWSDPRLPLLILPGVLALAVAGELSLVHAGVGAEGLITDTASGLAFALAGLVAWRRRPDNRSGRLMTAIGIGWFGGDLLFAPVPLVGPLSFGLQAAARVLFAWLLLAFPSGRLGSPVLRAALAVIAIMAGGLGALQVLTIDPADLCGCPGSPLAVLADSALAERLNGITGAVGLGMTAILVPLVAWRAITASAPARRSLIPVLAGGAFSLLSVLPYLVDQITGSEVEGFGWLPIVWVALPVGFLWALLNLRLARAAVADLIVDIDRGRLGRSRPARGGMWPAWLPRLPTMGIRIGWGAVLLVLAMATYVVPSTLDAFPPLTRLTAIAVGAALAVSGMVAWERRPGNLIGPLLVVAGTLWLVGRLQGNPWLPLALTANLSNSLAQVVVLAVLVAFPSGRIVTRAGWSIVAFGCVAVVGANLVQVASIERRTVPGLEGANPLYVALDPGLQALLLVVAQAAIFIGLLSVVAWLLGRWWRASGPARRTFLPVFAAGIGIALVVFVSELFLAGGESVAGLAVPVTAEIGAFALLPAGILAGVMRDRMARGAVADLVVELGETPPPGRLQEALASALGDPTLEIVQWSPEQGAYVDADGRSTALPQAESGRAVTLLEREGRPLAAITHDPALADDPGLVASVASAVRLAVENERLAKEVRAQLADVRASRARIVEAGDAERRRLERDLHDGAQQRLVALSLALRRAQSRIPEGSDASLASSLDDASQLVREALGELRELARGLHPAILTEAGLAGAVRSLAARSLVPVEVMELTDERLPAEVEAGAYFFVSEGLTNVAKHAPGARATVRVARIGDVVEIEVRDDGPGGATLHAGSGLQGLEDRMAALGGSFAVTSRLGQGTVLRATIPLAREPLA